VEDVLKDQCSNAMGVDPLVVVGGRGDVEPRSPRSRPRPTIAAIEHGAAIIAEGIIAAGPLFWLVLTIAHLAVRFGVIS
jgi:hypothetical protein